MEIQKSVAEAAREACLPFLAAVFPASLFRLMGLISIGFDKPGMEPPIWIIVSMLALQVLGMIAMAIVILVRFDHGSRRLKFLLAGAGAAFIAYMAFNRFAFAGTEQIGPQQRNIL